MLRLVFVTGGLWMVSSVVSAQGRIVSPNGEFEVRTDACSPSAPPGACGGNLHRVYKDGEQVSAVGVMNCPEVFGVSNDGKVICGGGDTSPEAMQHGAPPTGPILSPDGWVVLRSDDCAHFKPDRIHIVENSHHALRAGKELASVPVVQCWHPKGVTNDGKILCDQGIPSKETQRKDTLAIKAWLKDYLAGKASLPKHLEDNLGFTDAVDACDVRALLLQVPEDPEVFRGYLSDKRAYFKRPIRPVPNAARPDATHHVYAQNITDPKPIFDDYEYHLEIYYVLNARHEVVGLRSFLAE